MLELLGAILGNADTALGVLAQFPALHDLAKANPLELEQVHGVGKSGAVRIKAALELGRRLLHESPDERFQIRSPADAATLLMPEMSLLEQEHLKVILLDTRNRVITTVTVYVGSLNMSIVRSGELFREAIRLNAAAIIIAHNHPSGDPAPSPEDVSLTRTLIAAGQLLDIERAGSCRDWAAAFRVIEGTRSRVSSVKEQHERLSRLPHLVDGARLCRTVCRTERPRHSSGLPQ